MLFAEFADAGHRDGDEGCALNQMNDMKGIEKEKKRLNAVQEKSPQNDLLKNPYSHLRACSIHFSFFIYIYAIRNV